MTHGEFCYSSIVMGKNPIPSSYPIFNSSIGQKSSATIYECSPPFSCNNTLTLFQTSLSKDYYIDGQNSQLILFEEMTTGGRKRHPKLHPLKRFTSRSIKWGVKLYFEFTRSWSLSCSNTAIFWQITWNYRFWSLYNSLRIGQDSEFAKFGPRTLKM